MPLGILKASEPYEIISNLIAISQRDTFKIVRFPPQNGRLRSSASKIYQLDGSLLGYYDVPLLLTTDGEFFALTSDDQVVAAVQQQVDGMRAAAYGRSETLDSEVTVLNSTSALYRGTFSRQRSDGGEISRLTATYLVIDGAAGRRISVLTVHSP